MKKLNKILLFGLTSMMLMACDDVLAKPSQVTNNETLITFENGTEKYYNNDYGVIYDQLVDSGTSNSTILQSLIELIAKPEVSKAYNFTTEDFDKVFKNVKLVLAGKQTEAYSDSGKDSATKLQEALVKQVKKTLVDKVTGGSYDTDHIFYEEKLVNELKTSLYTIGLKEGKTELNNGSYIITPDSTFEEIFNGDYSDYIEKSIFPDIYKSLLTSIYVYNFNYASIGRAYARNVKYIKLDSITNHSGSVSLLINKYFDEFTSETGLIKTFDLYSLSRIYKGLPANEEETKFIEKYKDIITTKIDVINEDIAKFATVTDGKYEIITADQDRDDTLLSTYTGNYSYPISHGKELKINELKQSSNVIDNKQLVIKSGGVTDLPDDLRNRLFSASVNSNLVSIGAESKEKINILTPKYVPNGSQATNVDKYAYYDSGSSAYYIAVVENTYNTSSFIDEKGEKINTDVAFEISRILGANSTNQKSAIVYYLDKYDITYGDQDFYDYIESTYPDVLDDNYSL